MEAYPPGTSTSSDMRGTDAFPTLAPVRYGRATDKFLGKRSGVRVQRASAATKVQAICRGCNSRAKVDIPTVGKRLARLQADRQGFASLAKAMVLAAATAAVVFLQSDVGGAHAVESALQRAVRPTPTHAL